MNRLCLGGVQFGLNYGVSNTNGIITPREAKKIIAYARDNGIKTIDTASSYAKSEEALGKQNLHSFKVITKFCIQDLDGRIDSKSLEKKILKSQAKLKHNLYGFLVHDPQYLIDNKELIPSINKSLDKIKNAFPQLKVGFSIQHPEQLDFLMTKFNVDIIQGPYNPLDQRIKSSGWLQKLYEEEIEFHARSIFLQGVLLSSSSKLHKYFLKWENYIKRVDNYASSMGVSVLDFCLGIVKSDLRVKQIIVGISCFNDLKEITESYNKNLELNESIEYLACNDLGLIDPTQWNGNLN